ncbi:hypothetical protein E2562_009503 [Oryza meyeriana var. granulata]|uniref:AB hydrolase-1 domain-containing protein n=1 Tax=Oryza meyeriana var. granulata TaxID=110450 RepID=A0A6G1BUK7_9ORYZ|nr:hypothetical protein E2562_009503 [Oryza meyeriana var. granulata]
MKQRHAAAATSALFTLLPLSLLLFRLLALLVRLRLAAFRDAALSLHLLARLRIRPVHLRLPGPHATTLRVWCPAEPSSKPPLLLLHGFGGDSKWTWARNLPTLSRHFHVYAPDLLFFGAHSRSRSPLRTVAFQARCAAEAMRLLGVDRYDVVGISYGGFVVYRLAAMEARDRVPRVVVMTSGVAATPGEMREMAAREERAVEESLLPETADGLRRLVRRSMHRPPPWMPDFVLDDFIKLMCVDQRKERAELLHELLKNGAGIDPLPVLTQQQSLVCTAENANSVGRQGPGVPFGSRPQTAKASRRRVKVRDHQGRRARVAVGGSRASEPLHQVVPTGRINTRAC